MSRTRQSAHQTAEARDGPLTDAAIRPVTRRVAIAGGAAVGVLAVTGQAFAHPEAPDWADAITEFADGAGIGEAGPEITINAPDLAEYGNSVPLEIAAEGAVGYLIVARANPHAVIARITLAPELGGRFRTRIRLADSQPVEIFARLANGRVLRAGKHVAVTVGGCVS